MSKNEAVARDLAIESLHSGPILVRPGAGPQVDDAFLAGQLDLLRGRLLERFGTLPRSTPIPRPPEYELGFWEELDALAL